jgi:LAS superfamily LD-carboxypeptidase LdcB
MSAELALALTGLSDAHVVWSEELKARIHPEAVGPFLRLREHAARDGIDLRIDNAFRGFDLQLRLWNERVRGQRPLRDRAGTPLDRSRLSPREVVAAIMNWLAVPGSSRHHWGTDIDVYDGATKPNFVPQAIAEGGSHRRLHLWLEANLAQHGFFRPYDRDRGGVAPEWWHVSYAPVSERYFAQMSLETLHQALAPAEIELKDEVIAELPRIFEGFVRNINRHVA